MRALAIAAAALTVAAAAEPSAARGGLDPNAISSEAAAIVDEAFAALQATPAGVLADEAANLSAAAAADAARGQGEACLARRRSDVGAMPLNDLLELQRCLGQVVTALMERLIELKALQQAARFDVALFGETARRLVTERRPAREAALAFRDMARSAAAAADRPAERAALAQIKRLGDAMGRRYE